MRTRANMVHPQRACWSISSASSSPRTCKPARPPAQRTGLPKPQEPTLLTWPVCWLTRAPHVPNHHSVLVFIITILLLAADFYYLKNIAGRRLVGLRWWNEVDPSTGDSKWVFESSEPGTKTINPTDSRFFWLANYAQPLLWVALAVLALVRLMFIWLPLVGESWVLFYLRLPLPRALSLCVFQAAHLLCCEDDPCGVVSWTS